MAEIYKVKESWMRIWVRNGPGTRFAKTGIIYGKDDDEYEVSERQNKYWLNIGDGRWVCDRDSNGMMVMKQTGTTQAQPVPPEKPAEPSSSSDFDTINEETYAYMPDTDIITTTEEDFIADLESSFRISNLRGIFGMPYQFMASVDRRVSDGPGSIGRKYAKEIVSELPILLILPGLPRFMPAYDKKDRDIILSKLVAAGIGANDEDKIGDIIGNPNFGKYYSLEPAYDRYFDYVNPMCRFAARMMELQDETIDGVDLDKVDWSSKVNDNFDKLFTIYNGCTAWYCDSETDISDSFSNDTTESMIASKINNSLSDAGRELNFILGTVRSSTDPKAGGLLDNLTNEETLTKNVELANQFVSSITGDGIGNVFSTLTNSVATVATGGKVIFPEIWSGSSFGRSYDIKLKLVSPDGDDLSIYLNIVVPLMHIMALAFPRESEASHGYKAPFLVKAFYKGLFNVDMGIITSLNITKGRESAWSKSGIPLTVDVSFTIKDLYDDIYISNTGSMKHNMFNNIILMDYISNLCGININEVDVIRSIDLFFTQNVFNRITDTWHMKMVRKFDRWLNNKVLNIFSGFR